MKIIILGMDNTGKTTLALKLSQELDLPIIKSCGPKVNKNEMENFILESMLSPEDGIYERFVFFEEMVYGSILRGKSNFSYKDDLFKNILNSDAIIVYCRPHKRNIKQWNNREQMEGVIENSDKLIKRYDKVIRKAEKRGLKVIRYNYITENVKDVISKL